VLHFSLEMAYKAQLMFSDEGLDSVNQETRPNS
jgi:hypothetical protein